MRGKPYIKKRNLPNDEKYQSPLIAKFINKILLDGKKQTAKSIVYKMMAIIEEKTKKPALEVFTIAISNVSPLLEVKPKRIGGATYQVPMEVSSDRKEALSTRWIIQIARAKQGKNMEDRLAEEILNAYNKTGSAMQKRENMHKMAEANKAFAHFARF